MSSSLNASRSVWCHGLLLSSLLFPLGCGGPPPLTRDYGDVSGKVTLKGEAVKAGSVAFQPMAGAPVTAKLQSDGTYSLKGVVGENRVFISSDEAEAQGAAASPGQRKEPLKTVIPPEYGNASSPLKFEVKAGQNKADFDLQ